MQQYLFWSEQVLDALDCGSYKGCGNDHEKQLCMLDHFCHVSAGFQAVRRFVTLQVAV